MNIKLHLYINTSFITTDNLQYMLSVFFIFRVHLLLRLHIRIYTPIHCEYSCVRILCAHDNELTAPE